MQYEQREQFIMKKYDLCMTFPLIESSWSTVPLQTKLLLTIQYIVVVPKKFCSLKIKLASKTLKNHMLQVSWFYLWAIPLSGSPLHLLFSFYIQSGIHVKNFIAFHVFRTMLNPMLYSALWLTKFSMKWWINYVMFRIW